MHYDYQAIKVQLNDTDLLIENDANLLMVEYKNGNVMDAFRPDAFQPETDKKVSDVFHKFYDLLPYSYLLEKTNLYGSFMF